ncbi:30476_t:CDS:2, partial [Gigaspora margarita]
MPPKRIYEMIKIPKLATQGSKYTKLFVIGSNICGELGLGESVEEGNILEMFKVWSTFILVTKSKENSNETDKNVPVYVQGLDDIRIVKVAC